MLPVSAALPATLLPSVRSAPAPFPRPVMEDGQLVAIVDPHDRNAVVSLHWTEYGHELSVLDRVRDTFSPGAMICAVVEMTRTAFQLHVTDWAVSGFRLVGSLYRVEVVECVAGLLAEEKERFARAA